MGLLCPSSYVIRVRALLSARPGTPGVFVFPQRMRISTLVLCVAPGRKRSNVQRYCSDPGIVSERYFESGQPPTVGKKYERENNRTKMYPYLDTVSECVVLNVQGMDANLNKSIMFD